MLIVFDTVNIYYLPQYEPVIKEAISRGHQVKIVAYRKNISSSYEDVLKGLGIDYQWVQDQQGAVELYEKLKPDWVFFGNQFPYLDRLHKVSKTAQLGHGVGPKPSYYHKSSTPMTVRFMEGDSRLNKIKELYPRDEFVQVGYSKLDPLFQGTQQVFPLEDHGLDPNKPTILYAPTFNPSSLERFPNRWPSDFADYNILVKPHTFTYTIPSYKNQRDKLRKWSAFENVYVAPPSDLSLLPYMASADILLSEASSTLFEFVSLDKPVIVCDFYKLKWSYRGPFKYRFNKRFGRDNVIYNGIGLHVDSYKKLLKAIPDQLSNPSSFASNRKEYTREHIGPVDGQSSVRILDYLEVSLN